jgi:hypothetical protein
MHYLNLARALVTPVIASLCAVTIISLQLPRLSVQQEQTEKVELLRQENLERIRLSFIKKMPSFGFNNLLADWVYLNFIQYFGDSLARQQTGYSLIPEYFETFVQRDPRFIDAYFYLSPATSLFAGRPDRSVALIEQGLKSISPQTTHKAYLLWLYKGVDELLFLGNTEAARHSYNMAAQWASISPDTNSQQVAVNTRETARFIAKNPNSVRARIGAWQIILSNARDDATRQLAILNIQKLGGEVIINHNGNLQIKSPVDK